MNKLITKAKKARKQEKNKRRTGEEQKYGKNYERTRLNSHHHYVEEKWRKRSKYELVKKTKKEVGGRKRNSTSYAQTNPVFPHNSRVPPGGT